MYYAQHTPHKLGVEPVLMTIVDNLYYISRPENNEFFYDFDGENSIINKEKRPRWITFSQRDYGYEYSDCLDNSYAFDKQFNFLYALDENFNTIDTKTINQKALLKEIHDYVQPIVDYQTPPVFNLQGLFDWYYHDKFN